MRNLEEFAEKVKEYLTAVGHTQNQLAYAIILTPEELNRRLNGKGKTPLNCLYVKKIIKALAEWKAFEVKSQVRDLLALMDCPDFDDVEWQLPPLVTLKVLPENRPACLMVNPNSATFSRRPYLTPPPAPDQFGGRDEELFDLKAQMKKEDALVLTAVKGLGGIGKTTLSKKLANDLFYRPGEKIFKAVLWKEVKPGPDPLRLLLDWVYLIEPAFLYKNQSIEQLALQVKGMLEAWLAEIHHEDAEGQVLVIFDDVWDDGVEAVRLLRQACPEKSTVLITTRSGKVAARLSAKEVQLDKLEPDKGAKLLLEYLPEADPVALRELAVVLDGHPLAMALAAKRLQMEAKPLQSLKLLRHIEQYREGLPAGTPFSKLGLELGDDREENLTTALYYSYAELNPREQELFQALGILPYKAPFNEDMLVSLWELPLEEIESPCNRLRLLSLLDMDSLSMTTYGGVWYRQHPLVHAYAHALLNTAV